MPPPGYNSFQILGWNIGQILLHRLGLITITRDNVSHTQTEYIASNSTIANSIERTLLQPIVTMQNSTKLTQNQKTYELHGMYRNFGRQCFPYLSRSNRLTFSTLNQLHQQ